MTKQRDQHSFAVRANIWVYKLSRNWLKIALTGFGIWAALPWVAPTLMQVGLEGPARVLYTIYSPFCHQMAFRSIFIYGEQNFYPRAIADTPLQAYEAYANERLDVPDVQDPAGLDLTLMMNARAVLGNETMGYKTALCARDVAIYLALFVGGLIFAVFRRRLRPMPIWLYVIVGLGPIGLDGFSQLLSYPPFNFWPVRETAPFFRVATGAFFGLANAWLAFPYIERSMQETHAEVAYKLRRAGIEV